MRWRLEAPSVFRYPFTQIAGDLVRASQSARARISHLNRGGPRQARAACHPQRTMVALSCATADRRPATQGNARPVAFVSFARSDREGAITDEETAKAEAVRSETQRAFPIQGALGLIPGSDTEPEDAALLCAASRASLDRVLFDQQGRLLWLSERCLCALHVRTTRFGASQHIVGATSGPNVNRKEHKQA
mgnify:CR=1 FL=1